MTPHPEGLMEAFWAYETALGGNDLDTMDRLFDDSPTTLRGDAAGLRVGIEEIRRFRQNRARAPRRRILATHVQPAGDGHALVVAVTELASGGRGQQTQLWRRRPDNTWVVTAAHVSVPAPALDSRIWRVVGDPLVGPTAAGLLDGQSIAVKDMYAVQGFSTGAGNPLREVQAPVETAHAWALDRLLGNGASLRGIARTDEYAYSLAGTNAHHGTPPNPAAPGHISGGSSSGSATAVAYGQASIGLGSDTGGSIRVPAAYQGLFGIRTTHGAVPTAGMLPLAPRFDTVGWLTRCPRVLRDVGRVLLAPVTPPAGSREVVVVTDLVAVATGQVRDAIGDFAGRWGSVTTTHWPSVDLSAWRRAFVTAQAAQAWESNREWLASRMGSLGPDIRARFEYASRLTPQEVAAGHQDADRLGAVITELVGEQIVVLPSAPTPAPLQGADLSPIRDATIGLTCVAGLAGLPSVNLPLSTADRLPCGVSLIGPAGSDAEILELAVHLAESAVLPDLWSQK